MNTMVLWLILMPLGFAVTAALADKAGPRVRRILAGAGVISYALLAAAVILAVYRQGAMSYAVGGWAAPFGIEIRVDVLSSFFLAILAMGLPATVFFIDGTRSLADGETPLIFLLTAAAAGMIVATDLFNLFVFVEMASICSVALIALKRRREQVAAGFNYLIYSALSGMIFLIAIMLVYGATGHLSMDYVADRIHQMPAMPYTVAVAAIITAFGIKIGLIPLHFWQSQAYAAAGSGMAAFLSGVIMKVYLYALIRLLWHPLAIGEYDGSITGVLLICGAINVLGGHTMALVQNDLKRMLAFSSVAHIGYILMGFGAGSRAGMIAALYHVINHFFMKSALFWSGRAFLKNAQSADIRRFQGAATAYPLFFGVFFIGALTIIGVPPTGGFNSKWLIALAVHARSGLWPVFVIALGTLISLTYYGRIFRYALMSGGGDLPVSESRASFTERLSPVFMAAGCILAGVGVRWLIPWLERAAGILAK